MAWTLYYLLIGTTVMTVSAHVFKHFSSSSSDHDPRKHYKQENRETHAGPYNQTESRRGDINSKSEIVYPGPTSELLLEIPDDCRKLGFCEKISNYPHEQVRKLIDELGDLSMFQKDKLDLPEIPDISPRFGSQDNDFEELCDFTLGVSYPEGARDANNKWHVVVNQKDKLLQGFRVEICNRDSSPCRSFAKFQPGHSAECKQKFAYREMGVLHKGKLIKKSLKVPSCCSCVAKQVNNFFNDYV